MYAGAGDDVATGEIAGDHEYATEVTKGIE